MNKSIVFIAASLFFLLAGCAQTRIAKMDSYWAKPGQAKPSGGAAALLYYADYLRTLSSADYAQEMERAHQRYETEKTDFAMLQYALALSDPGAEPRKSLTAAEVLLRDTRISDPELNSLAQLLAANLAERRRLEAGAKRAEASGKRADELEKKVEALKNIEKNMIQRDPRTPGTELKQ